jgi:transposase InsO family protein
VVLDAFSRRVVGWSIADHLRTELVVDALQMAIWRRPPAGQTIAHSDHGSTYPSRAFGRRLRSNGLLGSMGSIDDCFDNSVAQSFFGTLHLELLDEHHWESRHQLAQSIFEWIEAWSQPAATPQLLPDAQSRAQRSRPRGMINNQQQVSAGAGEAQDDSVSCSITSRQSWDLLAAMAQCLPSRSVG